MERELILACVLVPNNNTSSDKDVIVLDVRMNVFVKDRAATWFGNTGDGSFSFCPG